MSKHGQNDDFTISSSSSIVSDNPEVDLLTLNNFELDPEQQLAKVLLLFCRGLKNQAVSLLLTLENKHFYNTYKVINIENLFSDKPEPLDDLNIIELLVRSTDRIHEYTNEKIRYMSMCLMYYPFNKSIRNECLFLTLFHVKIQLIRIQICIFDRDISVRIGNLIKNIDEKIRFVEIKKRYQFNRYHHR